MPFFPNTITSGSRKNKQSDFFVMRVV
uniref:Uncharacterized protein n=1 Tax=Anguilla anguilla TaxID=7936 RepID=A0A0E9XWS4_ANGAN